MHPHAVEQVGSVRPHGYVYDRAPMLVYWETTLACGLACSELFSGAMLSSVLQASHDLETRALLALANGHAAPTLSLHTSAGVTPALPRFLDALTPHLPVAWRQQDDDERCVPGAD